MSNLIIFDLDGVITSEDAYWDTAGLVIHELLYSPRCWNVDNASGPYQPAQTAEESCRLSRAVFPEAAIMSLKARSVNSNWDTCYGGFCLYLIYLLSLLPDISMLLPLRPAEESWIATFREQLSITSQPKELDARVLFRAIDDPLFRGYTGVELLERFNAYASKMLGHCVEGVFARYSPSWKFCENLFQQWYLGDNLYTQNYGHAPAQSGKPGCIHFERPLLPLEQIHTVLETLHHRGYTLGIATGRPEQEALLPLKNYGLLKYFDEQRITTHAGVARAEAQLHEKGDTTSLVKPHPYQFLLAANPAYQLSIANSIREPFIVVGDTPSDVRGGHAAGALVVAVKSGARTAEARLLLEQSQPDFLIEDMTELPMLLEHIDSLATIQRLQFTEREKAELLLQRWFARHMNLHTQSVILTPKAVSLNSFNGFYRTDGEEYFFKTHVEEQGVLKEYYSAELLRQAGYNIVRPVRTMHEQGQQMVIYPVIRWPVMFDLMRSVEIGDAPNGTIETLVAAERRECERLLDIYAKTLAPVSTEENASAPIHQLFWHRLTGKRLKSFYAGKRVLFPHSEQSIPFDTLLSYRWKINGIAQQYTLGELIERATDVLSPARAAITIIGHGDAHFGNVFLENNQNYLYFDPAFAGRHSPLLDAVKPLFHNVFATWMYFPFEINRALHIDVQVRDRTLVVEHNYELPPVRQAILHTKEEYLLKPLLAELRFRDVLPADWLEIMQSALMCCPLLTMNLIDRERMPASISWLGFAFAVLMGNNGITSWKLRAD